MNSLKDRFERDLDRLSGHPAWREIQRRASLPELTSTRPPRRRRLGALLLAAALTTALVAGLFSVAGDEPAPPRPEPETPATLRISCRGGSRERVPSDEVALQPDGLHVEIAQEHAGKPSWVIIGDQHMGYDLHAVGRSSPDGHVSVVMSSMNLAAGELPIGCFDGRIPPLNLDAADFQNVWLRDPDDVWLSTRLACGAEAQIASDGVDLTGVEETDIPRALLDGTEGLRSSDVVEPAGFAESKLLTFRAVRDGEVLARYEVRGTRAVFDSCEGIGDPDMWRG
jgi:hypothetical protein